MTDLDNDTLAAGLKRKLPEIPVLKPITRRCNSPALKRIQAEIDGATTDLRTDNDGARARETIRPLIDAMRRIDAMCSGQATPSAIRAVVIQTLKDAGIPRFEKTYCSQCGGRFGAGDHGYSHCSDHRRK